MLGHSYMHRHNEVVRSLHLLMCNKYELSSSKNMRTHSVQEVIANSNAKIRVDTRIKTDVKIQHDRTYLCMIRKGRRSH